VPLQAGQEKLPYEGEGKNGGERTGAHCGVFTLNSGDFSPFVSIYGSNQSYEAIELAYENKQC